MLKYVGYVKLLVNKLNSLWFVGAMCTGTTHGSKYVTGICYSCSKDKNLEKCIFSKIASQISKLSMGEGVCICFEVLCSQQSAEKLVGTINSLTSDEAAFVDKSCNWSKAKNWAEWWLRPKHLQMLHKDFFTMDPSMWSRSP